MDKHLLQKKVSAKELALFKKELKKTKDLCSDIAACQNTLYQLVTKLSKLTDRIDLPGSRDRNSDYFSILFSRVGRPMKINEVMEEIALSSEEVIPIQIINIRAYLSRRLNQACQDGVLVKSEIGMGEVIYSLAK
jgi:hypothetical protein